MSFWASIVAIAAIIAWANVRMAKYRAEGRRPIDSGWDGSSGSDSAYTAALEREVADLRKRLEVVERIVTDDGETRRLASEIESLRDR